MNSSRTLQIGLYGWSCSCTSAWRIQSNVVRPTLQNPVGTGDNREQNISMGREGCDFSTTDTDFRAEGVGLDDVGGVRHTTAGKNMLYLVTFVLPYSFVGLCITGLQVSLSCLVHLNDLDRLPFYLIIFTLFKKV